MDFHSKKEPDMPEKSLKSLPLPCKREGPPANTDGPSSYYVYPYKGSFNENAPGIMIPLLIWERAVILTARFFPDKGTD